MYSLNEQLGQAKSFDDQTRAARNDHWRQAIYRSVSYDAVNTGTKGTVRSNAWKRYRNRKASLFADPIDSECTSPTLLEKNTWVFSIVEIFYFGKIYRLISKKNVLVRTQCFRNRPHYLLTL